jgi:molybdenum cofactor cytidylyltransferase
MEPHFDKKEDNLAILILAAGASSRMGSPKQLLPWKNQPLIRYLAAQALALPCRPVVVVTGAGAGKVDAALQGMEVEVVFNHKWASGMGYSLAFGIEALEKLNPITVGVMIILSDQPLVEANYLKQLRNLFFENNGRVIAASKYGLVLGPPLIFGREFFEELKSLQGDRGAKDLLRKYHAQVKAIEFPDGALDWDTPEDVASTEKYRPH